MDGAREYAKIFEESQQHGKLFIYVGSHARGFEFHIYVLPSAEPINGSILGVKNAVMVYGPVSGQIGWNERYGWLHLGPWVKDFNNILKAKKKEKAARDEEKRKKEEAKRLEEEKRIKELLKSY